MRIWLWVLLVCFVASLPRCNHAPEEGVAAVVNGYKITYEELEKHYQNQIREMTESPTEGQARTLRLTLLREMIDREIMLQRAERLGLLAVDAEVEAALADYRSPYNSEAAFQRHLDGRGMLLKGLKSELRRTVTVKRLLNEEIASKISVTDEEIRKFYESNRASFHLPEQQFHLAQIVVTATPEAPVPNHRNDDATDLESARQKIQMIEQRLKDGEDFSSLARRYSEDPASTANGGDLGFVSQSHLGEADLTLRGVVASLSPGEVSPIIQSDDQFRIIKLISTEAAGQRELDDPRVQQTIRRTLRTRKEQLLRDAYLEMIRNRADVENYYAQQIVREFGITD